MTKADCDFVVIGGLALQIQGGDYITFVFDAAVSVTSDNSRKIAAAFAPFHPEPIEWTAGVPVLWDEKTVQNWQAITVDTDLG